MKRAHVLVSQPVFPAVAERLAERATLDINPGPEPWSAAEFAERLQKADAMMGFMTDRIDAATLAGAPRLRMIACALKGYDSYDLAACRAAGVRVSIVPDLLTAPTAELAVGLAIALARHLRAGDERVRSGAFQGWRPTLYGRGLDGACVAILGVGAVGRAIAQRLGGFGCRLLGVDSAVAADWPAAVQRCSLDEALAQADYVFVALPLNPATLGLIDQRRITQARPGTLWINIGRGSVVDEAAMAAALANGQAGGYAADVFAFEDWSLPERPNAVPEALRRQPNTVFCPHLGSAVREVRLAIEQRAADNLLAFLAGEDLPDGVA
ncbi:NAD(P)-dependent oxidoreductase [Paucibacter sp. APW11]|uniref:NAD(P)-dependent oxidoreductase n=1 Tax=Roseateles aquae TaxID=3077235 RepID=A0ABU3PIK7_9BURK|nr:NAD(P)-dependent oxidoreductase [Paucibacter sp. APW11]MDT9002270.1 NAD(P)-dependent oxidoreductase [Paucibacter sp. APW11]